MPLLQIQTSAPALGPSACATLLNTLSAELARELDKPESYIMVILENSTTLLFAGSPEPACFAALKNIGAFPPELTARLSALLTQRLSSALAVSPQRIYLEFVEAKPHLWGYDGATFA